MRVFFVTVNYQWKFMCLFLISMVHSEVLGNKITFIKHQKVQPNQILWRPQAYFTQCVPAAELKTFPSQKLLNRFQGRASYKQNNHYLFMCPETQTAFIKQKPSKIQLPKKQLPSLLKTHYK